MKKVKVNIVEENVFNGNSHSVVFNDAQKVQLLGMDGGCPVLSIITKDRKNYVWPLMKIAGYMVEDVIAKSDEDSETQVENTEKQVGKEYYEGMLVTKF